VCLQEPLVQQSAFQELCALAEAGEGHPYAAERKRLLNGSDNGAAWCSLSRACVTEVRSTSEIGPLRQDGCGCDTDYYQYIVPCLFAYP
jgi:hypothetical protein